MSVELKRKFTAIGAFSSCARKGRNVDRSDAALHAGRASDVVEAHAQCEYMRSAGDYGSNLNVPRSFRVGENAR